MHYYSKEPKFKQEHPIFYWIIIIVVVCSISFLLTAGLLRLLCWIFNWSWWSWKISLGVWILWWIVNGIFSKASSKRR